MTTAADSTKNSYFLDFTKGVFKGTAIMLAQAGPVTCFNRISVVSCYQDAPMLNAVKMIFQGTADNVKTPSVKHFCKGMVVGHIPKEAFRVIFKSCGIMSKPFLDEKYKNDPYGKIISDGIFAGGLTLAEMAINPLDVLLTWVQSGQKIRDFPRKDILTQLYKGAGANGFRQFGTWLGFPLSERMWSKVVDDHTRLDSHSILGILVKSFPQSFQITMPVWPFQRLKYELQYHPDKGNSGSRYMFAFKHILATQSWRGFKRGLMPKVLSNWILIAGADYLLDQGRKMQKNGK